jgi:hypothetical protein
MWRPRRTRFRDVGVVKLVGVFWEREESSNTVTCHILAKRHALNRCTTNNDALPMRGERCMKLEQLSNDALLYDLFVFYLFLIWQSPCDDDGFLHRRWYFEYFSTLFIFCKGRIYLYVLRTSNWRKAVHLVQSQTEFPCVALKRQLGLRPILMEHVSFRLTVKSFPVSATRYYTPPLYWNHYNRNTTCTLSITDINCFQHKIIFIIYSMAS